MLKSSQFEDIKERNFQEGRLPDLLGIESRPESLFVEARKPLQVAA